MDSNVQIIEKPDWVSWDDIKQCLYEAHAPNRAKGINMAHYQWPVEKIKDYIGENGLVLVALDGKKLVGMACIKEKFGKMWFDKGRYAYFCFDAVLPEYAGQGIFKKLDLQREFYAKKQSYEIAVIDTHENNNHRLEIAQKSGYRLVRYFRASSGDHYSVMATKWLSGCPYSDFYCKSKFYISKMRTLLITKILHR